MKQIYILILKKKKYYIGSSDDVEASYLEHINGKYEWTRKYEPDGKMTSFSSTGPFDEDNHVKMYMAKYGIDNVRGGSYSTVKLNPWQRALIEKEIRYAKDLCFNCGQSGHYIKECSSPLCCIRCGKLDHDYTKCRAKKHINGTRLVDSSCRLI